MPASGWCFQRFFREVVRRSFEEQADERGVVRLKFNRISLVAVKA